MQAKIWGARLLLVMVAACGGDDGGVDGGADGGMDATGDVPDATGPEGATAAFAPGATPLPWGALPFPNDLYLGADGTVDLASLPVTSAYWSAVLPDLNARRGFCRSCVITFPIEGALDPAAVPPSAPVGGSGSASDAVVLMRLDGASVGASPFLPLTIDYSPVDEALLVRQSDGYVLSPATTYVAALTDAIPAEDGTALAPTEAFAAIRDGDTTAVGYAVIAPGLDALEAAGIPRARVVAATVFTTEDTAVHLEQLRAVATSGDPPVATFERLWDAGALDALLGTPSMDVPGFVDSATEPGETAVWHGGVAMMVAGSLTSPRVVEGEGKDGGFIRRAADGAITAGPTDESVPFVLTIPEGADVTNLPVVFMHTGLPGSKIVAVAVAATLAQIGIATISIDPFMMGERAQSAVDERNEFRGIDGADGFYEQDGVDVGGRLGGTLGVPAGSEFHPGYFFAHLSQWQVDMLATVRFLREGDVGPLAAADASLAGLAFDPAAIYFIGLSYGSMTGISAMAVADGVSAAVFNVPSTDSIDILCNSPQTRAPYAPIVSLFLGIRGAFDEETRHLCLNPSLNLFRWYVEPVYASTGAGYLLASPLRTDSPDVLVQLAGRENTLGRRSTEAIGAIFGFPHVGALDYASAPEGSYPISANFPTGAGMVTAGTVMYPEGSHELIYLRSVESRWSLYDYPFDEIEPFVVDNPVDAVHAQIAHFFETRLATGRAEIVDGAP